MKPINLLKSVIILGLGFLIALSGCKEEKIKIALMLGNMEAARWQKDKDYFIHEAAQLGCEGIVVDANFDESLQLRQAEELISQGVKVLVLAPVNSNTGGEIVRYADSKGVKTIAYDSYIANCPLYCMVSFDNVKVGSLMAEYALNNVQSGSFIIIGGDKSNLNAVQIRNGQDDIISNAKNKNVSIIYSQYVESWSREDAYVAVKNFLKLNFDERPVAILGANDNIADGAIQAYNEENIPLPVITGQDASILGCRNILLGRQSMTVYKSIKKLSYIVVTYAYNAAIDKTLNMKEVALFNGIPAIYVDVIAVDKNNMESTVIADGFLSKEEILNTNL